MKVLVTGGTGSVGRATVERLVGRGWDVLVIGRRPGLTVPGAAYAACDVTRLDDLCEKTAGRDAIVHLAAIPEPHTAPAPEVVRVNVMGTVNVFEAAARQGVRRVVQTSSINALGCAWSVTDLDHIRYFPIDEAHPTYTTDPYSFSKQVVEEVGAYYWRRDGISSVALRLPWVHRRDHCESEAYRQRLRQTQALLDEITAMPPSERAGRLAGVRRQAAAWRAGRPMEYAARGRAQRAFSAGADPLLAMAAGDRFNFWTFVDERDAAQSVEKGLLAPYAGSHVLFINDSHNWLLYETERLLAFFFPEVTERRRPLPGASSPVSTDRARDLIGFEPEHSVARLLEPRRG